MSNLFYPSEQYEPKNTLMEFVNSPFGFFLDRFGLKFVVRAKDDVCEVYDKNGIAIEVEPWMYLYIREDGSLYTDWE